MSHEIYATLAILVVGASLAFLPACQTLPGSFDWLPWPEAEEVDPEPPDPERDWMDTVKEYQAYAAAFLTVVGLLALMLTMFVAVLRPFQSWATAALATGLLLSVLTTVMDHWLWPYVAFVIFIAFVAWKIHKYRKRRQRDGLLV